MCIEALMKYLGKFADRKNGINESRVYLEAADSSDTESFELATRFLRDGIKSPIAYEEITPGPNMTVKFVLNRSPKVVVGCELSHDNQEEARKEIRRILRAYSILLGGCA